MKESRRLRSKSPRNLKRIAKDGNRTVIMTIHQPAAKVFTMFDKVLFLASGKTTFLGSARELLPYMRTFCKKHNVSLTNPGDDAEARGLDRMHPAGAEPESEEIARSVPEKGPEPAQAVLAKKATDEAEKEAKRADKQAKKGEKEAEKARKQAEKELRQLQRDAPGSPEAVQGGGQARGRKRRHQGVN